MVGWKSYCDGLELGISEDGTVAERSLCDVLCATLVHDSVLLGGLRRFVDGNGAIIVTQLKYA